MVKVNKVEAVEKTVRMWEWLACNPSRYKRKYFEEFGITDRPRKDDCYLCDAFREMEFRRNGCPGCPLYEAGEHCFEKSSAFYMWMTASSEVRSDSAQKIVDICKRWLEEHYNPAIKGTRYVERDRVFEETGEFRSMEEGEWFVGDSNKKEREDWGSVLERDAGYYGAWGKRVIVEEVFPKPLYKAVMVERGRFYSLNSWVQLCREVEYVVGEVVTVGNDTEGIFCYETEEEAVSCAKNAGDMWNRCSKQWAVLEVIPLVKNKWVYCNNPLSVKVVGVVERSVEEPVWEELGRVDLQVRIRGGNSCMMIELRHGNKTVAQIPFNGDKWHVMGGYKMERSEETFSNMDGFGATFFRVLHKVREEE